MSVKQRPILNPLWVFERQVGTVALAPSEPLRVAEDGASAGCWVIVGPLSVQLLLFETAYLRPADGLR